MTNGNKWMGAYWLLVLTVFIAAAVPALGASTGTTGAAFLKISVGPRASAMGSAYAAVAEEPYAMYYNPASIASTERWEVSAMHSDQFAQVNFDYVGLAAPAFRGRSAWGLSIIRMASDDYFRTELDDGSKFTNQDLALAGTYAHRIIQPLSVGATFKLLRQTLAGYTANGWAVDFGAHLKVNPRLSIGASMSNIGPEITFISIGDPLPTTFRVGGAFKLLPRGNLLATMDYWIPKDDADGVGIGIEYRANRFIAFRGGYQVGSDFTGFSASTYGLTFNFENFGMDYAFVPREKLGDVHRAGLNVTFGGRKPQVVASKTDSSRRRRSKQAVRPSEPSEAPELPAAPQYYEPMARKESEVKPERTPRVEPDQQPSEPVASAPVRALEVSNGTQRSISEQMALRQGASAAARPREEPSEKSAEIVPVEVMEAIGSAKGASVAPPEKSSVPTFSPETEGTVIEAKAAEVSGGDHSEIVQEKISLSASLMKQQRYEEAIAIIRSGLKEDPANVSLWYLLSEAYYKFGDYDQAMDAVSRALAIIHGGRM